jgi:hypothetical protein
MRIAVDIAKTFAAPPIFMTSDARTRYNGANQPRTPDVTKDGGVQKWTVTVVVTVMQFGKPKATLLPFTVVSPTDPADGIPPGSPVEPVNLVQDISEPKLATRDGKTVIDGGRPYYVADAVRPLAAGKGA